MQIAKGGLCKQRDMDHPISFCSPVRARAASTTRTRLPNALAVHQMRVLGTAFSCHCTLMSWQEVDYVPWGYADMGKHILKVTSTKVVDVQPLSLE